MTDNLPETKKWPLPGNPPSETARLMEAITRAASDPAVDVVKIERLMEMYERLQRRKAEIEFNDAMSNAQAEMDPVRRDSNNPQTHSRYASYYALDKEARPIYSKHGFSLSYNTGAPTLPTDIRVICYVARGGYVREYSIDMPADGKGAKGGDVMTRTHATKSGITYGKRTLLEMIFNLAVGGDDDGNAASRRPAPPRPGASAFITPAQVSELRAMLDNSTEREHIFRTRHLDGAPLEDVSPLSFEECKRLILAANAKRAHAAPQAPAGWVSVPGGRSLPPKPQNSPTGPLGANLGPSTGISRGTEGRSLPSGPGYEITYSPGASWDVMDQDCNEVVDPKTGEVTEPDRPTMRPRPTPPRPGAQPAVRPSPTAGTASRATNADTASTHDNGMPWQLRIVPVLEHAPDFGTATLPELLHYQNELFSIAESPEQAAEIFAHHIRDHYRKLPWPPQADTLRGTWDKMVEERLR